MTRHYFGNSCANMLRSSPFIIDGVTTAGRFDPAFNSSCIQIPASVGNAGFLQSWPFSSVTTIYTLQDCYFTGTAINGSWWYEFRNSSSVPIFVLVNTSTNNFNYVLQCYYWNGSTYVATGSTFNLPLSALHRVAMKLVCGVSGTFDLYLGGVPYFSTSGFNAATNNVAATRLWCASSGGAGVYYSMMLGASFDTRDSRYCMGLPVALGSLTDGVGAASDVNEEPLDETTGLALSTSGHKRSYTHPNFTVPTGWAIGAACVGGRIRIGTSGPTDAKFGLYKTSTATGYSSAAVGAPTGYEGRGAYWETDPSTGVAFTQADWNGMEGYVEAV